MNADIDSGVNTTLIALGASAVVGLATVLMLRKDLRNRRFWPIVGRGAKNALQTYLLAKKGSDMILHRPIERSMAS